MIKRKIVIAGAAMALSLPIVGCSLFTKQNAKTALDALETTCVLLHNEIADVKALAEICNISQELEPELRDLIAARKIAASAAKKKDCE